MISWPHASNLLTRNGMYSCAEVRAEYKDEFSRVAGLRIKTWVCPSS